MNAMWKARPVTAEEKARLFLETQSFAGEIAALKRERNLVWKIIGIGGVVIGMSGMTAGASVFPLKTTVVKYIEVDRATGQMSDSVGAEDAPKLFNEQTAAFYIRAYIEAREGYVPVTDDVMFHRVTVMSSVEEQKRYAEWHSSDKAPRQVLGKTGYARAVNFHPSLQASGNSKTLVYLVPYQKIEVRGDTIGQPKDYIATIQFQWHPEKQMSPDDRQINPGGFQAIAYQSDAVNGASK